jgi:hypothetical protein
MWLLHLQVFHRLIQCLELLVHCLVYLAHLDLNVSLVNQLLLDGGARDSVLELLGFQAGRQLVEVSGRLAVLIDAG